MSKSPNEYYNARIKGKKNQNVYFPFKEKKKKQNVYFASHGLISFDLKVYHEKKL